MRRWLVLAGFATAFAACGGCSTPVVPVIPVTPPGPTPVDPGPTHNPAVGTITLEDYQTAPEAGTKDALVALLGPPFRDTTTGGFNVLVYAIKDSDSVAWFFVKDGVVVRKQRL